MLRHNLDVWSCSSVLSFSPPLLPPLSFHICITDVSFHFAYATFTTNRPRRTSLDRCSRTSTSSSKPNTTRHQSRTRRKSGKTSDHRGKHEDAAARDCNGRYVMFTHLQSSRLMIMYRGTSPRSRTSSIPRSPPTTTAITSTAPQIALSDPSLDRTKYWTYRGSNASTIRPPTTRL